MPLSRVRGEREVSQRSGNNGSSSFSLVIRYAFDGREDGQRFLQLRYPTVSRTPFFYQLSVRYHLLFGKPTSKYWGIPIPMRHTRHSSSAMISKMKSRIDLIISSQASMESFFFPSSSSFSSSFASWRIIYFLLLHRNMGISIFNFPKRLAFSKILISQLLYSKF